MGPLEARPSATSTMVQTVHIEDIPRSCRQWLSDKVKSDSFTFRQWMGYKTEQPNDITTACLARKEREWKQATAFKHVRSVSQRSAIIRLTVAFSFARSLCALCTFFTINLWFCLFVGRIPSRHRLPWAQTMVTWQHIHSRVRARK